MRKILVVGSLNMDQVTKVDVTPKVGQTVLGEGLDLIPGGKGANQAVAMGKLGANVTMVGAVGNDSNGTILLDNLKKMNVQSDDVKIIDADPTGIALIMVNASGDNSIVVVPGANRKLSEKDIEKDIFKRKDFLVCQLETPINTVKKALKTAKENNVKTILNPAPAQVLSDDLLSTVDILIPNETEFEILTGIAVHSKQQFLDGCSNLQKAGVKEIIVTLGDKGVWYYNGVDFFEVKAKKVKVVDTTSAGDSFIGGLVTQLALDADIKTAIEYGNKVAAITVTRFGAQSSLPSRQEVADFI